MKWKLLGIGSCAYITAGLPHAFIKWNSGMLWLILKFSTKLMSYIPKVIAHKTVPGIKAISFIS